MVPDFEGYIHPEDFGDLQTFFVNHPRSKLGRLEPSSSEGYGTAPIVLLPWSVELASLDASVEKVGGMVKLRDETVLTNFQWLLLDMPDNHGLKSDYSFHPELFARDCVAVFETSLNSWKEFSKRPARRYKRGNVERLVYYEGKRVRSHDILNPREIRYLIDGYGLHGSMKSGAELSVQEGGAKEITMSILKARRLLSLCLKHFQDDRLKDANNI